jgi:predicted peroxiredoxin
MSDDVAPSAQRLVIKSTTGMHDAEKTNLALTVAASAVAAGVDVSLWLTGESTWLAVPGRASELVLDQAAPAEDLFAAILEAGTVTVCTQCAARRGLTEADVIAGVRIAGAPKFVEEIMSPLTQAVVY